MSKRPIFRWFNITPHRLLKTQRYVQLVKKKTKHPYLFQCKLSYGNETGTNHHGLLSTLVWCLKMFLTGPSTWGSLNFIFFFQCKPPNFFNKIVKFTSQIAWKQIFTTFLTLIWELLDVGIIANARIQEESFPPKC